MPLAFGDKLIVDTGIRKEQEPFLPVVGILGRKVALGGIVDLLVGKAVVGKHGLELLLVRPKAYATVHVDGCVGPDLLHITLAGELEHAAEQHQGPGRDAGEYPHIFTAADVGHDLDLLVPLGEQGGIEIRREKRAADPWQVVKHDGRYVAIADIRVWRAGDTPGHHEIFVSEYADLWITMIKQGQGIPAGAGMGMVEVLGGDRDKLALVGGRAG